MVFKKVLLTGDEGGGGEINSCIASEDYQENVTATSYAIWGYCYALKTSHIPLNTLIFQTRCVTITGGQTLTAAIFIDGGGSPSLELPMTSNGQIVSGTVDISGWSTPSRHKIEIKYKVSAGTGVIDLREIWVSA